jgi:NAD(P)-dependent dehydrogenase (short-subunit alcohol dehydrogenase family)
MDVADDASVAAAVGSVLNAGETLDVVVNNAGIAAGGPLEAFSSAQVQELFNINAFGPLRVDRAVLPHMRARGTGLLLHVSSTLGRILPGGGGLYPASKWALEGLIESLHYQVAPFGIDVVILEPGSFPTPAVSRGLQAVDREVAAEYARRAPPSQRARATADYVPPDIQEVADAVKRLIELPQGKRPLRSVVGPVFTTGVEEFNQLYEQYKQRLAESLRRPDQATPWARPGAPPP